MDGEQDPNALDREFGAEASATRAVTVLREVAAFLQEIYQEDGVTTHRGVTAYDLLARLRPLLPED